MSFALTITPKLAFSTASPLSSGTVGAAYSQKIDAVGGTPPYTFFIGNPPPGLTINTSGVLSGTPTAPGTFTFDAAVTDSTQASVTKTYQLSVVSAAPLLQVSPLSLAFTAAAGGHSPGSQTIRVIALGTLATTFSAFLDGGSTVSRPPPWSRATPTCGPV